MSSIMLVLLHASSESLRSNERIATVVTAVPYCTTMGVIAASTLVQSDETDICKHLSKLSGP